MQAATPLPCSFAPPGKSKIYLTPIRRRCKILRDGAAGQRGRDRSTYRPACTPEMSEHEHEHEHELLARSLARSLWHWRAPKGNRPDNDDDVWLARPLALAGAAAARARLLFGGLPLCGFRRVFEIWAGAVEEGASQSYRRTALSKAMLGGEL